MPAYIKQERPQLQPPVRPENVGYVYWTDLKPLHYTDLKKGLASMMLVACSKDDRYSDIYRCPPTIDHFSLKRPELEEPEFVNQYFVERLWHGEEHAKWMITDIGVCRTVIQHINSMSPN